MLPTDSKQRKQTPITTGVLDYFPKAIAAVARVSFKGNEKHNPGEPLHWAREKSIDHADCIGRHLMERGTLDTDGERHSAHLAWRALAMLEVEIEHAESAKDVNMGACAPSVVYPDSTREYQASRGYPRVPGFDYPIDLDEHTHVVGGCDKCTPISLSKPVAYISGPIRGYKDNNFPAFDKAKALLEAQGYRVISPADMDRKDDPGLKYSAAHYVNRDVAALLEVKAGPPGSVVVHLIGHERSTGATAETAIARWLDIPIRSIQEFQ